MAEKNTIFNKTNWALVGKAASTLAKAGKETADTVATISTNVK